MPKTELPKDEQTPARKIIAARQAAARAELRPFNVHSYQIPNNPTTKQVAQAVTNLKAVPDWLRVNVTTETKAGIDPETGAHSQDHPVIKAKIDVSVNVQQLADSIMQRSKLAHFPALMEGAVYEPALGTWRTFSKGEWRLTIRKRTHDLLKAWGCLNKKTIADVFDYIDLDAFDESYRKQSPFDAIAHPELVAFKNGTYNMLTDKMESSRPDNYLLNAHDYAVDPNKSDCPETEKLLKAMLGKAQVTLQEFIGYMFYHSHKPFQEVLWLSGTGGEGKSTLLGMIGELLGRDNYSAQNPQDLSNPDKRFSIAELYGKEANIVADIADTYMRDTSMIKRLTGGDVISAEFKGITGFNYVNYSKQIFAANALPSFSDTSAGFARRMTILKMVNGNVSNKPEFWKQFDMAKIERERPAFAMKCMHLFKRAFDRKAFTKPPTVRAATREWLEENDRLQQYIEEGFEVSIGNNSFYVEAPYFNANFKLWLQDNSYSQIGVQKVKKRMVSKGFIYKDKKVAGKSVKAYFGIRSNGTIAH